MQGNRTRLLRLIGLLCAIASSTTLLAPKASVAQDRSTQNAAQLYPARTLRFPIDSSMGELYKLRQVDSSIFWGRQDGKKPIAAARGTITIAAGTAVRLCVMYEGGLDASPLSSLKGNDIQSLDLTRVDFNPKVGKYLANLSQLHEVTASDTEAGDDFVHDLVPLKQLQCLTLNRTPITDRGLEDIAKLKDLRILSLSNDDLSDKGIAHLSALKSLTALHVDKARLTDAGLKSLEGLKKLRYLTLTDTNITDAGLASISKLDSLVSVSLGGTKVRGPGLKALADLKKLEMIQYSSSTVAPHCITALQKALPHCFMSPAKPGKRQQDKVSPSSIVD